MDKRLMALMIDEPVFESIANCLAVTVMETLGYMANEDEINELQQVLVKYMLSNSKIMQEIEQVMKNQKSGKGDR